MNSVEDDAHPVGKPARETSMFVVSASKLETRMQCARKYGFKYICKIYPPEQVGGAAALGTAVHTQLEEYLKGGDLTFDPLSRNDPAEIAASMTPWLPRPGTPTLTTEREFWFSTPRSALKNIVFMGRIDWEMGPGSEDRWVNPPTIGAGYATVGDHKTTSNFRYLKTSDMLLGDIQAMLYANEAMSRYQTKDVALSWGYGRTTGARKAERTHLVAPYDHVVSAFREITSIAEECAAYSENAANEVRDTGAEPDVVLEQRKSWVVSNLPHDATQCEAYGGCPYRGICNLTPIEKMRATMSSNNAPATLSLMERLKARNPSAATPAINPPGEWSPPPAPESAAPIVAAPPAPPPVEPPQAVTQAEEPSIPETVLSEVKKRTRRTKAEMEAAKAQPSFVAAQGIEEEQLSLPGIPAPTTFHETDLVVKSTTYPLEVGALHLYVDCLPYGIAVSHIETAVMKAKERVNAEHSVSDYRFIEYGKGKAHLSATLLSMFRADEIKGHYAISLSTEEGQIAFTTLAPVAASVVRGV